jgi:hypothetical protein
LSDLASPAKAGFAKAGKSATFRDRTLVAQCCIAALQHFRSSPLGNRSIFFKLGGRAFGREPSMTHFAKSNYASRVGGIARGLVWGALGICVAAATIYDIGHWITVW